MGQFLVDRGRITGQQLDRVYDLQAKGRARLGVIAVTEKLITIPQAEQINAMQATADKRFGDLAVELGYLTPEQVDRLLERQGNEFMAFCQAIVDYGAMTLDEVSTEIVAFQEQFGLMDSEIEALRNNDLNRIVPIFVRGCSDDTLRLLTIAVKTIYRLLDSHVTIGHAQRKTVLTSECVGYQKLTGGAGLMTSVVGTYKELQDAAMLYTREEFIETREDVLDALCELINCINGLYATEVSTESTPVELEPPVYQTTFTNLIAPEIYSLPVYCGNTHFFINISGSAVTEVR
jgi:CheY-specific phosphatase CheX